MLLLDYGEDRAFGRTGHTFILSLTGASDTATASRRRC